MKPSADLNKPIDVRIAPMCREEFQASVEDADLEDTIRSRWYIDPDPKFTNQSPDQGDAVEGPSLIPQRQSPVRPPPSFTADGSKLANGGLHRVVLVVTDGVFLGQNITDVGFATVLPDGGTDPYGIDTFEWFVNTVKTCQ